MESVLVFFTCLVSLDASAFDDFTHQIDSVLPFLSEMLAASTENDVLKQTCDSSTLKTNMLSKREVLSVRL
jgi:hypothetical protein